MSEHDPGTWRKYLGYAGVAIALPVVVWLALGWLPFVPSAVAVFGVEGLRFPTGVAVAGLMLAAIGFWEN